MTKAEEIDSVTADILDKMNEQLRPSGWYNAMILWWHSAEWKKIIRTIVQGSYEGQRFAPESALILRFLYECPIDKLKVVILNNYSNGMYGAIKHQGIAWASKRPAKMHPVLNDIYQGIQDATPGQPKPSWRSDTAEWAKQGVLLLPLSPTSVMDKKGQEAIWAPALIRIVDTINTLFPDIVWIAAGVDAVKKYAEQTVYSPNIIYGQIHTDTAAYKMFMQANEILKEKGKTTIKW